MTTLLALVGSERPASLNQYLAASLADLAPAGTIVEVATDLGGLPHYGEDLDGDETPQRAAALRRQVASADGLVLVTPEFNGGPSSLIKNAVDWASRPFRASSLMGKPALVLGASTSPRGAAWAREALQRNLTVGGAAVLEQSYGVASAGDHVTAEGVDAEVRDAVTPLLSQLVDQAAQRADAA